jgi:primary-amine oxidase
VNRVHIARGPVVALLLLAAGVVPAVQHPMDPLEAGEIARCIRVLEQSGRVERGAWLPYLRLMEPPKDVVRTWQRGQPLPTRRAEAFVFQGEKLYRAEIDLDAARETDWREIPDAKPPFMGPEFAALDRLVRASPEWQRALSARGIGDPGRVVNLAFTVGHFGDPTDRNRRLFAVATFSGTSPADYWGRHLGGLVTWVDARAQRVVRVVDTGAVPIPATPASYDGALNRRRPGLNEIEYAQSSPSYQLDGHEVAWQNWTFHWRVDPQTGLVLSNIRFAGRDVLYQASMSEMFVPYMDPGPEFYFRTFIDAGEYGLGRLLSPLRTGIDVPRGATVRSVTVADPSGRAQVLADAVGVFERYSGDPLWRHDDALINTFNGLRDQELVVRTIATAGNYDYIVDWAFRLDGSVGVAVGSTGQPAAKSVKPVSLDAPGGAQAEAHGRFVGDHTVAVHHDHFVVFRLDFDVDGPENRFIRDQMRPVNFPPTSPRTSGWTAEERVAQTESDAQLTMMDGPGYWRVASSTRKNAWGRAASYRLMPGMTATSLLDAQDWPQRRAGFAQYTLWVTPYDPDERYAAGAFPNQSDGRDGLHVWARRDRNIRDTDIVAWYVMGMHHIVRAEDWPVQPVLWKHLEIMPHDFFDRNPMIR